MSAEHHVAKVPAEPATYPSSRKWCDVDFFVALFLSSSLVIVLFILRRTLLPIFEDLELDLSRLTLATLNLYAICTLAVLPVLVVSTELSKIGTWRKRINAAVTFLSLALGLIAIWAVLDPFIILIDSMDG